MVVSWYFGEVFDFTIYTIEWKKLEKVTKMCVFEILRNLELEQIFVCFSKIKHRLKPQCHRSLFSKKNTQKIFLFFFPPMSQTPPQISRFSSIPQFALFFRFLLQSDQLRFFQKIFGGWGGLWHWWKKKQTPFFLVFFKKYYSLIHRRFYFFQKKHFFFTFYWKFCSQTLTDKTENTRFFEFFLVLWLTILTVISVKKQTLFYR